MIFQYVRYGEILKCQNVEVQTRTWCWCNQCNEL